MRQIILSILGIAILAFAIMTMRRLMNAEGDEVKVYEPLVTKVFVDTVKTGEVDITVELNGRLEAVNKTDIFAEVQGIFQSKRSFRPGTYYKQGETVIDIDSRQELANLRAQRSNLLNQIVKFLPDIKFDYPEAFDKWSAYVEAFDVDKTTAELPKADSEREKYFIAAQNISSTYFNIKNLEARLSKYRIRAPFSGVLTETNVNPGTLIRAGQKLGTLTGQNVFELALPVRESYLAMLEIGQTLTLFNSESGAEMKGRLVRVNPQVEPLSQTVTVYVQLSGKGLKEGTFFSALLPLKPAEAAMRIDRKLLLNNEFVFTVEEGQLKKRYVIPVHFDKEEVVIKGLSDGELILNRPLPSGRENMSVQIVTQ